MKIIQLSTKKRAKLAIEWIKSSIIGSIIEGRYHLQCALTLCV